MESVNEKPRWYSIKKAAEYLDIGEQTLYRWMREGQITYRKVGDSFWKEDLDAVMQVFHSEREAARVRAICPLCHHEELVEGRAQSTGLVYFRPKKSKFWTLKDASVATKACMCSRCGVIMWFGDVEKLNALRQEIGIEETHVLPAEPEVTDKQ
jgi:excisionase family DNA binding protein